MNEASFRDDDPSPSPSARFTLLPNLGASAQAAIPGLYAWGVTVAPSAWAHGASAWAKVSAIAGVVGLIVFVAREPVLGWRARIGAVWSLILGSVVSWGIAPAALSVAHLDSVRAVAGMCGWGLFAFASAAPAIRRRPEDEARILPGAPLKARSTRHRSDYLYIVVGLIVAVALQGMGWAVPVVERALFVHLLTLACGVALVGAAADLALARHARRKRLTFRKGARRALPQLILLVAAGAIGLAWTLTHSAHSAFATSAAW